ncbi:MAG: SPOR domain-containing protein [Bacteroidales bacterium]|nr:SPOR domain-containing protein [Candidatus Liminaster caballi]
MKLHDMRALNTYIEYLLMTRHYAFVPGIGGFMLQEEDSRILRSGQMIPPHRMLKFNRFMDHDDGMLCNVIMQAEHLSFDEANAVISMQVGNVLDRVQHEGRCQLGHLGHLFCDQECHLAFIAADQMDNDPCHYGLQALKLRTWQEIENERLAPATGGVKPAPVIELKPERRTDVIELPKVWLRRAAIALLVVMFFFASLIPGTDSTGRRQYANIVDTNLLMRQFNNLDPQSWDESWEQDDSQILASIDSMLSAATPSADAMTAADAETAVAETAEPSAAADASAEPLPEKMYLIIVGSCKTLEEAEILTQRLGRKGYDKLGIAEKDGRFRIFINAFSIKTDAEAYLDDLRSATQFSDAWLLAVRTQSLLQIIKNKDNDQLPMELSHLNKRAERDQG